MKMKYVVALVLSCCLLPSCQTLLDMLTPKAAPAMVAEIMAKAEKVAFSAPKKLGKSSQERLKLKAGQWVTTLTTHKGVGNDRVLSTTRVIRVDGNTVVLESESYSALGDGERQLSKMTFENYPVKGMLSYSQAELDHAMQTMKLVRVVTKSGENPPQDMPEQALMMSQQMGKNMAGFSMRSGDMTATACSTSYITSARCYDYDYSVSVMGFSQTGRVLVHSGIPVTGLVRMESESMVQETIAFGLSGATSQF